MKPFRLRSLGVAAFFLAAADTTQVAAIDLEATVVYTASGDCGASTGTPLLFAPQRMELQMVLSSTQNSQRFLVQVPYLADGKCHKTDTSKSYRATRSADNSATIKTYTDA
ncbi:hypothetical protein PC116_g22021, partial [Phytophthora cactorum]